MSDIEEAKDKVMMGAERRSMVMTEYEKKLTAYHEGGHALVSFNMPSYDPIHEATNISKDFDKIEKARAETTTREQKDEKNRVEKKKVDFLFYQYHDKVLKYKEFLF